MPWELVAIGVGDYDQDSVFRRLPNAASDAARIEACFGELLPEGKRFHTRLMINPKADEATNVIEDTLERLDADSVFILYFAGHAIQERGSGRQWLLCKNALACFADGEEGTGAISSAYFNNSLERRGKGKIFVIIDACRNDPTFHKGLDAGLTGMDQFGKVDRTVAHKRSESQGDSAEYQSEIFTLYSCQPGERASDDGAFASALRSAVLTRVHESAEVRLDDAFVADVTKRVQEVNPHQKPCKRTTTTDFVLVPGTRRPNELNHQAKAAIVSSVASPWANSTSRKAGTRQTLKVGSAEYGFCWIPAGKFKMGSRTTEKDRDDDETLHDVELTKGFWTSESPVPQSLYEEVIGSNPSYFKGGNLPVERVSWYDAMKFCEELTKRLPSGLRAILPTEAQWEYACRAGTKTAYWYGDAADKSKMNYDRFPFFGRKTSRVKSYAKNAWGLYDMHGNVWEWVLDYYYGDYPTGTVVDPKGPDTASFRVRRVYRGGGWSCDAGGCRSAYRCGITPGRRSYDLGFRFLLSCD